MPSRIFIAREKSTSGYEASKDKLTLLLGANATSSFKLKSVLIYHSKTLSTFKNYVQSPLLVPYQLNNKASMTAYLLTTWFPEYFQPTMEITKKIAFKILLLTDNASSHPRILIEMYNEINVFIPANTIFILRPMDQGVIFTVKSYSLTNTVHKVIASIDSDSSNEPGKRKMETSRMHHSRCH